MPAVFNETVEGSRRLDQLIPSVPVFEKEPSEPVREMERLAFGFVPGDAPKTCKLNKLVSELAPISGPVILFGVAGLSVAGSFSLIATPAAIVAVALFMVTARKPSRVAPVIFTVIEPAAENCEIGRAHV